MWARRAEPGPKTTRGRAGVPPAGRETTGVVALPARETDGRHGGGPAPGAGGDPGRKACRAGWGRPCLKVGDRKQDLLRQSRRSLRGKEVRTELRGARRRIVRFRYPRPGWIVHSGELGPLPHSPLPPFVPPPNPAPILEGTSEHSTPRRTRATPRCALAIRADPGASVTAPATRSLLPGVDPARRVPLGQTVAAACFFWQARICSAGAPRAPHCHWRRAQRLRGPGSR